MAMAGYSLGSALNFVMIVFNVGAIAGAILRRLAGRQGQYQAGADRVLRRGSPYALSLMGYTKSTASLFVVVFVVGASTLGTQLLAYAYAGGFYPHAIRSTGRSVFASGVEPYRRDRGARC